MKALNHAKTLLSAAITLAIGDKAKLQTLRLMLQESLAQVNALEYDVTKRDWVNQNMGGN